MWLSIILKLIRQEDEIYVNKNELKGKDQYYDWIVVDIDFCGNIFSSADKIVWQQHGTGRNSLQRNIKVLCN